MVTNMFLNVPVKDLEKSKSFFTALGFSFNPQFTDDRGACLVINDTIYAMLLREEFFKSFTKKEIPNTSTSIEAIMALRVETREQVDTLMQKALSAGATEPLKGQDHGWMYERSFTDLDGHIWEFFFMDVQAMPKAP